VAKTTYITLKPKKKQLMAMFGWLAGCRLASHLTKSLFTSCQNNILLSQQSAETVFFSPAEQTL